MESDTRTRNRGQIALLETKLQAANEQCAQMEQERNMTNRQVIFELSAAIIIGIMQLLE